MAEAPLDREKNEPKTTDRDKKGVKKSLAQMVDVLNLYKRINDISCPLFCMNGCATQPWDTCPR